MFTGASAATIRASIAAAASAACAALWFARLGPIAVAGFIGTPSPNSKKSNCRNKHTKA
jgi:hypothetical protein